MTNTQTISHDEKEKLNIFFTGRSVVSVDEERQVLILDNGVKVAVIPNQGDCCKSGDYFLENLAEHENVITSVKVKETYGRTKEGRSTVYSLFVYSSGVHVKYGGRTKIVTVAGDDGSGYYGTGFVLEVIEIGKE